MLFSKDAERRRIPEESSSRLRPTSTCCCIRSRSSTDAGTPSTRVASSTWKAVCARTIPTTFNAAPRRRGSSDRGPSQRSSSPRTTCLVGLRRSLASRRIGTRALLHGLAETLVLRAEDRVQVGASRFVALSLRARSGAPRRGWSRGRSAPSPARRGWRRRAPARSRSSARDASRRQSEPRPRARRRRRRSRYAIRARVPAAVAQSADGGSGIYDQRSRRVAVHRCPGIDHHRGEG